MSEVKEPKPLTADEIQKLMPETTQKKYRVIPGKNGSVPGTAFKKSNFGFVDFRVLTIERAKELVDAKFPYLELIGKEEKPKEDTSEAKKV